MRPFRVTMRLATPVVLPELPTHLDGLLSWARVQEADDAGELDPISFQHDLPLERYGEGDEWCFKASWIDLHLLSDRRHLHYIRKSDVGEFHDAWEAGLFGKRKPHFDAARGATKAYSLVVYEGVADTAIAEGIGDIDRVRDLLSRVGNFGKLRHRGRGRVESCTVEEIQQATWTRRHLPVTYAGPESATYAKALMNMRAPYWERAASEVLVPV